MGRCVANTGASKLCVVCAVQVDMHWSDKPLNKMTERDWRIFRCGIVEATWGKHACEHFSVCLLCVICVHVVYWVTCLAVPAVW